MSYHADDYLQADMDERAMECAGIRNSVTDNLLALQDYVIWADKNGRLDLLRIIDAQINALRETCQLLHRK